MNINYTIKLVDKKMVKKLTVIHYGSKVYNSELVEPIVNENWVKPLGGLWTSPINSTWGWKNWCDMEHFHKCSNRNKFKLKFVKNALVMVIDDLEDLMNLPKISSLDEYINNRYIDFELVSKYVDAIWLTDKGQSETRLTYPLSLYGWDVETVLILNPKSCYQIK